jgi:hypothetical protein
VSPTRHRSYSWRNRVRDPALTTMLAVQCVIIFCAPFAAMGYEGVREVLQLLFFIFTFLVCLLSRGLFAEILAILALICALTGSLLQLVAPSNASITLAYAGSIGAFIVASYALGYAALAPGVVTVHRVLGAIALYLNLGLMFGTVYRLIWYFIPNSLTNIPGGATWQAYGTILYFSFVTLTSTGYGDVTPVHPLVRTLANVEAIIGQLYPATMLARLITLELRRPRRQPARSKAGSGGPSAEAGHDPDQGHHPVVPPS